MKKIIISIGIVIVIIICLIIAILVVRNNNNGNSSTGDASSTYEQNVEKAAKETVTEQQAKELIYNVEQCVSSYLAIINTNNSSYFSYDENGNEEKFVNENEKILNILSQEFIDENHITVDNIDNYVDKLDQDVFFIPLQANYLKNGYMYKYAINGYITDFNYNVIRYKHGLAVVGSLLRKEVLMVIEVYYPYIIFIILISIILFNIKK